MENNEDDGDPLSQLQYPSCVQNCVRVQATITPPSGELRKPRRNPIVSPLVRETENAKEMDLLKLTPITSYPTQHQIVGSILVGPTHRSYTPRPTTHVKHPPPVPSPRRSYLPVPSPHRSYLPVLSPRRSYPPVSSPHRSYLPVSSPHRSYPPVPSPHRSYPPVSSPHRSYLPVPSPHRSYPPVPSSHGAVTKKTLHKELIKPWKVGNSVMQVECMKLEMELCLKKMMESHPKLSLVKLPIMYRKIFNRELNYRCMGFRSLWHMCSNMRESVRLECASTPGWLVARPPFNHIHNARCKCDYALTRFASDPEIFPMDCMGHLETIPRLPVENLRVGRNYDVVLTDVMDISHFWFQIVAQDYRPPFEKLWHEMQMYYTGGEGRDRVINSRSIQRGQYCVSKLEVHGWHRAIVVKIVNWKYVKVLYVDRGYVETVARKQLRVLHRQWAELPAQAVRGALSCLLPRATRVWMEESTTRFNELVTNKRLVATITSVDPKTMIVRLSLMDTHTESYVHIAQKLECEMHAKCTKTDAEALGECLLPSFNDLENGYWIRSAEKWTLPKINKKRARSSAARALPGCYNTESRSTESCAGHLQPVAFIDLTQSSCLDGPLTPNSEDTVQSFEHCGLVASTFVQSEITNAPGHNTQSMVSSIGQNKPPPPYPSAHSEQVVISQLPQYEPPTAYISENYQPFMVEELRQNEPLVAYNSQNYEQYMMNEAPHYKPPPAYNPEMYQEYTMSQLLQNKPPPAYDSGSYQQFTNSELRQNNPPPAYNSGNYQQFTISELRKNKPPPAYNSGKYQQFTINEFRQNEQPQQYNSENYQQFTIGELRQNEPPPDYDSGKYQQFTISELLQNEPPVTYASGNYQQATITELPQQEQLTVHHSPRLRELLQNEPRTAHYYENHQQSMVCPFPQNEPPTVYNYENNQQVIISEREQDGLPSAQSVLSALLQNKPTTAHYSESYKQFMMSERRQNEPPTANTFGRDQQSASSALYQNELPTAHTSGNYQHHQQVPLVPGYYQPTTDYAYGSSQPSWENIPQYNQPSRWNAPELNPQRNNYAPEYPYYPTPSLVQQVKGSRNIHPRTEAQNELFKRFQRDMMAKMMEEIIGIRKSTACDNNSNQPDKEH